MYAFPVPHYDILSFEISVLQNSNTRIETAAFHTEPFLRTPAALLVVGEQSAARMRVCRVPGELAISDTGKNREDDDDFKDDSGQTSCPNESLILLANSFFFDDRVDTDNLYYTELKRQTDGNDCPPKALYTLVATLRDLELFLAATNKCLRLEYFPRVRKVAAIKEIPKLGKDDYSQPKSYCSIGLLPVMTKVVENMLIWCLSNDT
ncbi:hypothetical protein EVAR_63847_1 [Eumeta japonica]|uniref:Uncharacterized protein n=1 Tax=Eumeta variegata TaxID=151549 RepID=A0A4C1Z340_EUMVA|nr:hypothetical protein EVAR_63847_1 [Eumeta japonica]